MKPEPIPEVPRGVVRFYNFLAQGNPFLDDALAGLSQPSEFHPGISTMSEARSFQPGRFAYHAFHDRTKGCVTMYIESLYSQFAHVGGRRFDFAANETIDTGIAYQYSEAEFQALARQAGFASQTVWTDPAGMFSTYGMIAV